MSKKSAARKRATLLVSLSILVSTCLAGSAWGASETPGDTFAASVTFAGAYPEAGIGQEVTISGDGRYVAFLSESQDLDPEAPALRQAYVKDLQTGALVLASRAGGPAGAPSNEPREEGHWGVERPFISGNGRYLAFETPADNLVSDFPSASEFPRHVYRRDLLTGETTLVDRVTGPAGQIVPVEARVRAISDDGRYIVFSDHAEDLQDAGGEHEEGHETIYVRDLQEGTTAAVDRADGLAGELADEGAEEGAISHDDRYVLFTSASTNLDPDANGIYQVYRRDLQTGQTLLVSRTAPTGAAPQGEPADGESFEATFAGNSDCKVAFLGVGTTNLDLGGEDPALGVYLRDFCSSPPTTTLVSVRQDGEPFEEAVSPIATGDGRIGFEGQNLFPETRHFYLRDVSAGQTALVDRASGTEGEPASREVEWNAVSANGCRAAFTSAAGNLAGEGVAPAEKRQAYVRQLAPCTTPGDSPSAGGRPAGADDRGSAPAGHTRLKIAGLDRRKLALEFSGAGRAKVKVRRLREEPRHHWKLIGELTAETAGAGRVGVELPELPPGRYRVNVHLQGFPGYALVRWLSIGNPHSNTLRGPTNP